MRKIEEKFNFAAVFTIESMEHVPISSQIFSGRESRELCEIQVTIDEVLNLLREIKN